MPIQINGSMTLEPEKHNVDRIQSPTTRLSFCTSPPLSLQPVSQANRRPIHPQEGFQNITCYESQCRRLNQTHTGKKNEHKQGDN